MTHTEPAATAPKPGVRIDVWLWAARFFKTRSLAKHAIENGKVEVDGQRAKASRQLHVGDALVVVRGEERFELEVRGLEGKAARIKEDLAGNAKAKAAAAAAAAQQ